MELSKSIEEFGISKLNDVKRDIEIQKKDCIEEIKAVKLEFEEFINSNYDTLKDAIILGWSLSSFNYENDTNLTLDIGGLLTVDSVENNKNRIEFFSHENVDFSVELLEDNDKLKINLNVNNLKRVNFKKMEFYYKLFFDELTLSELKHVHLALSSYMYILNNKLTNLDRDKSLYNIFRDKISLFCDFV